MNSPSILLAVGIGATVLVGGSAPWASVLAPLNLKFLPAIPWAIAPMALYLFFYWRLLDGRIGPRANADMRRESLRANPLTAKQWGRALVAGMSGFAALVALVVVMARLVTMPAGAPITTPAGMPAWSALLLLVMSSVVAGVTEEAAFRGYMQTPVERRYGVVPAILVNGIMFGLLHFPNHPGAAALSMLPYYVAVAGVYSGVTWGADSILPAIVLHSGGDVWSLTRQWLTGRPEWQLSPSAPTLVWNSGVDAAFVRAVVVLLVLAAAAVASCVWLRRLAPHVGSGTLLTEV